MNLLKDFKEVVKQDEPLARFTYFQLGGPAQYLVRPRTVEQLQVILARCRQEGVPMHVLGGGSNLLVRDEGVPGVVLKLDDEAFAGAQVAGTVMTAGAGALLTTLIGYTTRRHLAGIEVLVGIPGSLGGALRMNAGGRSGDIGQVVHQVTVMDAEGNVHQRTRDELSFGYRESNIDEPLVLGAELELEEEDGEEIVQRMRKLWIVKKATQPLSFRSAGCVFKNPRGLSAGSLLDQAGMKGVRVGGAEVSERHANFVVAHPGACARDVLRLIDMMRSKVAERFGVELELEIEIW